MANIHVIIGEDDLLVAKTVKKLSDGFSSVEVFDSINSRNAEACLKDLASVTISVSTPPFLDPDKVTLWRNVNMFGGKKGDGDEKVPTEVRERYQNFAEKLAGISLPDNQRLIITSRNIPTNINFYKKLAACAQIVSFNGRNQNQLMADAMAHMLEAASELGLKFASGAAQKFIEVVGFDTWTILSELGKMRDYLGDDSDEITEDAIDTISSEPIGEEMKFWDVIEAISERDAAKANDAFMKLEGRKSFEVGLVSQIESNFRQLEMLKAAEMKGCLRDYTDSMPPWAVNKSIRHIKRWTLQELNVARERFLTLREEMVSSSVSQDSMASLLLVAIMRSIMPTAKKR